uniref:Ovule protein n=1 Tax=Caenorhabditis tropicalis TaxID=1561998 RepID=A0A1I7TIL3_9PELO
MTPNLKKNPAFEKRIPNGSTHPSNDSITFSVFCRRAPSEVLNYHKSLQCLWANLLLISSPYHNSSLDNFAFLIGILPMS